MLSPLLGVGMEEALYISDMKGLRHSTKTYTRLYYGAEFCEHLIPTVWNLNKIIGITAKGGMEFTFVTPYVSDFGLRKLDSLFGVIAKKRPNSEVVVNDFGVLRILNGKYPSLKPVLGRLLVKQQKDPRIIGLEGKVPEEMIKHYKGSNLVVPILYNYLKDLGIERVEMDNPLHGMDINLKKTGLSGSLHIPYVYVTTTRYCLANSCDSLDSRNIVSTNACGRECQSYTFKLMHNSMPVPLILKGNTQFIKNENIPKNLEDIGIDRLVHQPELKL